MSALLELLGEALCTLLDLYWWQSMSDRSGWRKALALLSALATITFAVWWFGGFTLP